MTKKKTIDDAITESKFTGPCSLDLDLAVKYFDDNTSISYSVTKHEDGSESTEYRIYLETPKTQKTRAKFTIFESDAFFLIEKLKLTNFHGWNKNFGNYYPPYSYKVLREAYAIIPMSERTCNLDEYVAQRRKQQKEFIKNSKKKIKMPKPIKDIITQFEPTGPCKIDIDLAVKIFNKNVQLVKNTKDAPEQSEYRVVETTPRSKNVKTKFTISEEDALILIKELKLIGIPHEIFKKTKIYYFPDQK